MKRGTIWKTALAVLLGASGLIAVVLLARTGPTPDPVATAAPNEFVWQVGAVQGYALRVESSVGLAMPGANAPSFVAQRVAGNLYLRVFAFDPQAQRARVGLQLQDVRYVLNGRRESSVEAELMAPVAVEFAASGLPESFIYPDAMGMTARHVFEELVRTFQIVVEDGMGRWSGSEANGTGRYIANYRTLADGAIEKQKTLFTEVEASFGPGQASVEVRASTARARLSRDRAWLSEATFAESLAVRSGTQQVAESTADAELSELEDVSSARLALFSFGRLDDLLAAYGGSAQAPAAVASGSDDVPELLARLQRLPAKRIATRHEMVRALRAQPDEMRRIVDSIRSDDVSDESKASLMHILEQTGTRESEGALVDLMQDSDLSSRNRLRAMIALGGTEASAETVGALVAQSRSGDPELANTALLAIGSVGNNLEQADRPRSADVRAALEGLLQEARGDSERTGVALRAIANMAPAELAARVDEFVDDPSPFVRASAAKAIGRIAPESGVERLTNRLVVEDSEMVRAELVAALMTLEQPTPRSLEAVLGLVLGEQSSATRFRMAQYLGENVDAFPNGLTALKALALRDESERIRNYAMSVVYGG